MRNRSTDPTHLDRRASLARRRHTGNVSPGLHGTTRRSRSAYDSVGALARATGTRLLAALALCLLPLCSRNLTNGSYGSLHIGMNRGDAADAVRGRWDRYYTAFDNVGDSLVYAMQFVDSVMLSEDTNSCTYHLWLLECEATLWSRYVVMLFDNDTLAAVGVRYGRKDLPWPLKNDPGPRNRESDHGREGRR